MEIEFVNHASFIVEQDDVRLLIDPWLEGYAFYEGWALISKTKLLYEDFKSITHIWFSHEHPDHFSPPVLNKIPAHYRKRITVLYQKTVDKKVVDLCRKLGFGNVIELNPEWYSLNRNLKIYNKAHTDGDSWICIKSPDCTILNVNDCIMATAEELQALNRVTGPIDVLFTQFSYANWAGNRGDIAAQKKAASDKLQEILLQNRVIQPKAIVPFASYIWFCHQENFYLNTGVNKIDFITDFISKNTHAIPTVMYPGDKWNTGNLNFDSTYAVQRYLRDWDSIMAEPPLAKTKPVPLEELLTAAKKFAADLKKNNPIFIQLLKPAKIYIEDYNCAFKFSLKKGLEKLNIHPDYCDIMLSSDGLNYCFKFLWGGGTLRVNGRYQLPPNGRFFNFKMFFQVSQINNFGQKFDLKYILAQLKERVNKKLKA